MKGEGTVTDTDPVDVTARRTRARRGEGERLRDDIILAAEKLLLETGDEDQVSMRAVAGAVGVTPPAIYMHFEDKDELIHAVCERPFIEFRAFVERAMSDVDDPLAALRAMGEAYVHFGLQHPEQYRLMMMTKTNQDMTDRPLEEMPGMQAFFRLVDAARACIDAGIFRPLDPFTVAVGLWVDVHGLTSLLISSKNFPWPDVDELIDHVLDVQLNGLVIRPSES
ncbi:MAG: TetR/AcrR family transcriptional regulator [Actinomycetota bacterium]